MKKGSKIALISAGSVVGTILVVILFVLAFGGIIAKQVVEKHSPQWVGRQITLDRPLINLFAGSVRITNLHMSEAPARTWEEKGEKKYDFTGVEDFARFDTLYAQINLFKLMGKEVWLNHIWLSGLDAQIIRNDSCFNFQDIIDHFSGDDSTQVEQPKDTTASPWGIGLYDIRFHRGSVAYIDKTFSSHWGMENINIEVPGVYFGKDQTEAGITLDFPDNNGSLTVEAHYDMEQQSYNVDLDLDTVRLDMAMPVVKRYVNLSQVGSSLTGCIKAAGYLDSITAVHINGNLSLDGTDVRHSDGTTLLTLQHVGVDVEEIDLGKMLISINNVDIHGLNTTFERWEERHTFTGLVIAQSGSKEADTVKVETKEEAESRPLLLVVKNVDISDINLTYSDHTLQKPFNYTIAHLGVRAHDVTLSGENDVQMEAELPRGGSIKAAWKGGMNFKQDSEHLTLTVKNCQLKDFSPWCEEYTATPITGGSLSITSENRLNGGKLRGTNKVDIYTMTVGKKTGADAPYKAVPVKLGIALLEDLNHKIEISLPVSGDINSPKFSYSKIIWQTIGNVLLKAVASPWVALAEAMGMGGDDLSKLEIDPLQPDFTSEQYATVDKLVEMMKKEEELSLVMTQQFCMEDAIKAQGVFNLKRAYYESQYGAVAIPSLADIENIKEIKDRDKGLQEMVEKMCNKREIEAKSLAEAGLLYYSEDSLRTQVMQIAEVRNRTLTDYLTGQQGIDASRVRVVTAAKNELDAYSGKEQYEVSSDVSEMEKEIGR